MEWVPHLFSFLLRTRKIHHVDEAGSTTTWGKLRKAEVEINKRLKEVFEV